MQESVYLIHPILKESETHTPILSYSHIIQRVSGLIFHPHPIRISFVKDIAAAWKAAQEAMDIPEGNGGERTD